MYHPVKPQGKHSNGTLELQEMRVLNKAFLCQASFQSWLSGGMIQYPAGEDDDSSFEMAFWH